jgi:hypothetical protein
MKANISRLGTGRYFATFSVDNARGAVGFTIENVGLNQWTITNQFDVEVNIWTTKKSMVEYLENCRESELIELSEKQY